MPAGLVVTAVSPVAVRLTWQAATDNVAVTGYRILRDNSPIGTTSATTFDDTGLTPGAAYNYAVAAYDAAGNTSPSSAAVRATLPTVSGNVYQANPANYLTMLRGLRAGDTLVLAAGNYDNPSDVPGLPLFDLNGTPSQPIVITGPETGAPAVLLGRSTHNTVRLSNASHIVIRNLEIDGRNLGAAGVAAQGLAHNITLENLRIRGVGDDQQTVGISTVGSTVWNWIVRRNVIEGAGTGIYFGNSDGRSPFIAGIIENNLIRDTIGYSMQIKHQLPRPTNLAGMPTTPQKTIIRNNVFSKSAANSSTGSLARPNLLVGHFPTSGPGSDDLYEVYGNFFYQNPTEALFQGEGNIAFYGNVMVNDSGSALNIQPHLDVPRYVRVFGNTIVASGTGIRVTGGAATSTQRVYGNAVFAATAISLGGSAEQSNNTTDTYGDAVNHLVNPRGALGALDMYPKVGSLSGIAWNSAEVSTFTDAASDFNGVARSWTRRGAYSGDGTNPGWRLALERKP